jgi:hypothetical protein
MSNLNKAITVVLLVLALGLQWTALQSVAWVSMFVKFSREAPLIEALVKTFDGQHPCLLCKIVKEGQQADQRPATQLPTKPLDLCLPASPVTLIPLLIFTPLTASDSHVDPRFERPLTPPPRSA